jgi:hypothetical protein
VNKLTINGYELDCNCELCGRSLKLGVITCELGVVGADCFVKAISKDKKRYSGNGKPSAEMVKQYSIIFSKGLDYAMRNYGIRPSSFVFERVA